MCFYLNGLIKGFKVCKIRNMLFKWSLGQPVTLPEVAATRRYSHSAISGT